MKNLNLENYGVQEMDAREMIVVEGGVWPMIVRLAMAINKFMYYANGAGHTSEMHSEGLQDNTRVDH